jgi:hypothetical protein
MGINGSSMDRKGEADGGARLGQPPATPATSHIQPHSPNPGRTRFVNPLSMTRILQTRQLSVKLIIQPRHISLIGWLALASVQNVADESTPR